VVAEINEFFVRFIYVGGNLKKIKFAAYIHPNTILYAFCWQQSSQKSTEMGQMCVYQGLSGSLITDMTSRFSGGVSGSGGRGLKP
jgi:hypothetical protein